MTQPNEQKPRQFIHVPQTPRSTNVSTIKKPNAMIPSGIAKNCLRTFSSLHHHKTFLLILCCLLLLLFFFFFLFSSSSPPALLLLIPLLLHLPFLTLPLLSSSSSKQQRKHNETKTNTTITNTPSPTNKNKSHNTARKHGRAKDKRFPSTRIQHTWANLQKFPNIQTSQIRRAPQSASVLGQLIVCSTGTPHDPTSMRLRFQLRFQIRSDCGSDLSSDLSSAPTPLPPNEREVFLFSRPTRRHKAGKGRQAPLTSCSPKSGNPRDIPHTRTYMAGIL